MDTKKLKQQKLLSFFQSGNVGKEKSDGNDSNPGTSASSSEVVSKNKRDDESASANKSKKIKGNFVRCYDKEYLKLGFIMAPESELSPRPLCVVCSETLSNDAMKPSKLARHFHSKHRNLTNKPLEFFERLRNELEIQKSYMKKITTADKSLLKSSYCVALQIAKTKKPFTIGEELIKPCIVEVASEILGPQAAQKLKAIPLSDNTIHRRIVDMAADIEEQVVEGVKKSRSFAIQLDESTDVSNHAILLCFARYEEEEDLREELLCCLDLPGRTTSSEIFTALNGYFEVRGLDWDKCVGVCTDGAACMTGHRSGVVAKIKEETHSDILYTHCIIHREQLAAKKLSAELNTVLNDAVKIVNEIRSRALNSRLFTTLCESMGSQHQHLLLHAEVRWLSRGKVLSRLVELQEEVKQFLRQQNSVLADHLLDEEWMAKLAYLADIFSLLNELNLSLQGIMTNVFTLRNKMDAFKKKLVLWEQRVQDEDLEMFPLLHEFLTIVDVNRKFIFTIVSQHLRALAESFDKYYPQKEDPRQGNLWITDPFTEDVNSCRLTHQEKESLVELSSDVTLISQFKAKSLTQFWISMKQEYPYLSDKALKLLVPFSTTYLCEKTFSTVSAMKTKYRNRMEVDAALRLAETTLHPRLEKIMAERQQHMSH